MKEITVPLPIEQWRFKVDSGTEWVASLDKRPIPDQRSDRVVYIVNFNRSDDIGERRTLRVITDDATLGMDRDRHLSAIRNSIKDWLETEDGDTLEYFG